MMTFENSLAIPGLAASAQKAEQEGASGRRRDGADVSAHVFNEVGGSQDIAAVCHESYDHCSDLANAHRLAKHFHDRLLYVRGVGWHTWGPPWRHDELGARRYAQALGKLVAEEAGALSERASKIESRSERKQLQDELSRLYKWASTSERESNVTSSLRMAEPLMCVPADQLDANADLLGLQGGVLDLRTLTHRAHSQADLITRQAGCKFDPAALAPRFESFIEVITCADRELADYLQRMVGYSLSGHRREHVVPICCGRGANGKSTLLGVLQALLGEYAGSASPDLLIQRGNTDHPTALASLQGKRLVIVSETGEGGRLHEERLKLLSGGDVISARRMRQDMFEFKPSHLLMLQTNHRPQVTGTDEGLWRRLQLIPFSATIPADQRDSQLPEKLQTELAGILNWAIEGYRKYKRDGLRSPSVVNQASKAYRDESNHIPEFIEQECSLGPQFRSTSADLYRAYSTWCVANVELPRSAKAFGGWLADNGFQPSRGARARGWLGICLAPGDRCD